MASIINFKSTSYGESKLYKHFKNLKLAVILAVFIISCLFVGEYVKKAIQRLERHFSSILFPTKTE
jgi:ABC-type sulfate transport system permease component